MTRFDKIAFGALLVGGLAAGATVPANAQRFGRSCNWYFARGFAAPPRCFSPVGVSFVARPGWSRIWWGNRWAWHRPGWNMAWSNGRWAWRRGPVGWRHPVAWRRRW